MISIRKRIYHLRRQLSLSQQKFGELLGIKGPYVSELETDKKHPSEQLILGMCNTLGVSRTWLEQGQGEMYDKTPKYTAKGLQAIDEINELLISGQTSLALSTLKKILQIQHNDIEGILFAISSIFRENDRTKIEAVKALLYAFVPRKTEEEITTLIKEDHKREALESIFLAKKYEISGNQSAAREAFLSGIYALKNMRDRGHSQFEFDEAERDFKDFVARDPDCPRDRNIIEEVSSIVNKHPGITLNSLLREMTIGGKPKEAAFFLHAAIILGKIRSVKKGKIQYFYPS